MAVAETVIIELTARVDSLERQLRRAGRGADRELGGIEGRVRSFAGKLTGLLGTVSAAVLVKQFLDLADASKSIDAQLRLASAGFSTFAEASENARRIAADTRSGLQETAALYGNFSRAAKDLGATSDEAARATETFSKTLKISGADAGQAASATLQFGQALASGALRGDELNSILEASPRLARLITESLGKPIGAIKAMGEAGQLTSDKLLNALTNKNFTKGIDAEFNELPVTFSDAMTQVENAAIITFGAFDRGGQFSTALANFITQGSDGFKELENDAVEMGIAVRSNIEGLVGAFGPIFNEAKEFFEYVNGQSAKIDIGRDIDKSLGQIDSLTGWLANNSYLGQKLNGTRFDIDGSNLQGRYRQSRDASQARIRGEMGERAAAEIVNSRFDRFGNPLARPTRAAPTSAPKKTGGSSAAKKAAAEARKAEQERLRDIREDAAKSRDSAQLQDDINAAKAALATATEDILNYQLGAIESERKQQVADIETQVKLGKLGRDEADERILINSELARLRGELVKRRAAEEKAAKEAARSRDEANTLQVESQLIDSRKERRDVELRILDLAYKEEEAAIRAAAARGEIADLDEALANLRRRRSAETEGVNRQNESPLEQRKREAKETATNIGDAIEQSGIDAMDRFGDSIANAATQYVKLGGIAGDVINGIIQDLVKLAVKQAIFGNLLGGGGGGEGGGIGGFVSGITRFLRPTMSTPSGARAAGGPVVGGAGYLVGENGPEYFRPSGSGNIVSNRMLNQTAGRAGGVQAPIVIKVEAGEYFDARVDRRATGVAVPISARQANQSSGAAYAASQQSAPGSINKYNQLKG